MHYTIEIYSNDDHPDAIFEANEPIATFSVDDRIHPAWRGHDDYPGSWFPGDKLRVVRVEHILLPADAARPTDRATRVKTMVYCEEELGPRPD